MTSIRLPDDIVRELLLLITDEFDYVHFIKACRQFYRVGRDPRRVNQGWLIFHKCYDTIQELFLRNDSSKYIEKVIWNPNFSRIFLIKHLIKFIELFPARCSDIVIAYWRHRTNGGNMPKTPKGPAKRSFWYRDPKRDEALEKIKALSRTSTLEYIDSHALPWHMRSLAENPNITFEWLVSHITITYDVAVGLMINKFGRR